MADKIGQFLAEVPLSEYPSNQQGDVAFARLERKRKAEEFEALAQAVAIRVREILREEP